MLTPLDASRLAKEHPKALSCQDDRNKLPPHFGHGRATSALTGRVKCFTLPHAPHFHASERASSLLPRRFRAFCASSRICSKTRRREGDVSAINSIPVGEGGFVELTFAKIWRFDCSCSHEHNISFGDVHPQNGRPGFGPYRIVGGLMSQKASAFLWVTARL